MRDLIKKFLGILTSRERRQLCGLLGLLMMAAFVEMVSIATVMPFLTVAADPDKIFASERLAAWYHWLGFTETEHFLILLGGLVFVAIVVSNSVMAVAHWARLRFVWLRNHSLARRLLERYLGKPYSFFLNVNSSNLSKNILVEAQQVTRGLMEPGLQAVAKGMVVLFIVGLLVVVEPRLALGTSVALGGAYGLLYLGFRRRLQRLGVQRVEANRERFKAASEIFAGIKEVKLMGRESRFLTGFSRPSRAFSECQASNHVIAMLPRYALEAVAFGGITLIALYLIVFRGNFEQMIPVLGLYAFGGYRLMPALHFVFSGAAKVRFNVAALEDVYRELDNEGERETPKDAKPDHTKLPLQEALALEDVTFHYPGRSDPALSDINLVIRAGTSIGLVGPTGSGKTTLVDLILGLLEPTGGVIRIDGSPLDGDNRRAWQNSIGYVPQQIHLVDDSVINNIAFGVPEKAIDFDRVVQVAKLAELHDFVMEELPDQYRTPLGERGIRLSGGQRQRIGLARALYQCPEVLVLDEATSALDGATEKTIVNNIARVDGNMTIIVIAHRLGTVRACDRIYYLNHGRIEEEGEYEELAESGAGFRKLLT